MTTEAHLCAELKRVREQRDDAEVRAGRYARIIQQQNEKFDFIAQVIKNDIGDISPELANKLNEQIRKYKINV